MPVAGDLEEAADRLSDIEAMPLADLAHALTQYAQRNITCASDLVREAAAQARH